MKGREWLYRNNPKLVDEAFKPEPRTICRVKEQWIKNVNRKHNKWWMKRRNNRQRKRNNWHRFKEEHNMHSWSFVNQQRGRNVRYPRQSPRFKPRRQHHLRTYGSHHVTNSNRFTFNETDPSVWVAHVCDRYIMMHPAAVHNELENCDKFSVIWDSGASICIVSICLPHNDTQPERNFYRTFV